MKLHLPPNVSPRQFQPAMTAFAGVVGSAWVMDLGRMNRVLELDHKLAYCVVEPGVGFFDLHDQILREEAPLWLSVPGKCRVGFPDSIIFFAGR